MELEQMINILTNNGLGIFCVVYIVFSQGKLLDKINTTLESINTRLTIIEENQKK